MFASDVPTPLTRFIGRQRELRELQLLLDRSRLVTVTGPGGSGKTRLAAELARLAATATEHHVKWIELAPLTDPALLVEHLAGCLRSQEHSTRALFDTLVDVLGPEPCLLVLDNCEHLVDAVAALVARLLRSCPLLTVLATSREALSIDGEHAWPLQGLVLATGKTTDESQASEATEFFVDRARAASTRFKVAPNLDSIDTICRRLDGMPLAIELAASRLGVLTATEIAERLDDLFRLLPSGSRTANSRQKTLRATVEWSDRLISDDERLLLRRLSVFRGSFALEAVESVCSDTDLPVDRVLDVLAGLVNRSLVAMRENADTARYTVLEFIRQYAAEFLEADPAAEQRLRLRHAEYYATLADRAREELERTHSPDWIARLTLDYDNLRSALGWSFASQYHGMSHRLVAALCWYCPQVWQLSELVAWVDQALGFPPEKPTKEWGLVLVGAGSWMFMTGDQVRARPLYERAVAAFESCGDEFHLAMALASLTNLLVEQGDLQAAIAQGERAAQIAKQLPEAWPLCHAMSNGLAHALARSGRPEEAESCLQEAADALRRKGRHEWGVLEVARARAAVAIERHQYDVARMQMIEAIDAALTIRRPHSMYRVLVIAQRLLSEIGALASAASVLPVLASPGHSRLAPFPEDARHLAESARILQRGLAEEALQHVAAKTEPESIGDALRRIAGELATEAAPRIERDPRPEPADILVRLLGDTEIVVGERRISRETWRQAKLLELLAYLLLHPEGRTREQIGVALWPEASSSQVKNNFHVLLHKLRRQLALPDVIVLDAERYRFNPALRLRFDASSFTAEIATARRDRSDGSRQRLADALKLYRGELLAGIEVGEWCADFQDELRGCYLDGLSAMAERQMEAGELAAAIATLQDIVRLDVQREESSRQLMHCLARTGQIDAALAHYRRLTTRLRQELAVEPSAATNALARSLQASS